MSTLLQDLRYGLRTLAKTPGFSAIAVATLALGIGATSVVFSFVTAVLTAAAPVADMDRLAAVWLHNRSQGETKSVVSPDTFVDWRQRQRSFDLFGATRDGAVNLSGSNEPVRVRTGYMTADVFRILSLTPAFGRTFTPAEERPGAPRVAILSHRLWRERFDADPSVLGREIQLDGRTAVIVGVLPENEIARELVVPLTIDPAQPQYTEKSLIVMARLRPGVSLEQARAEMTAIGEQLEREQPASHRGWGVNTRPLQEEFVGPQARLLFALLAAAAGAVLLIGCANIANLLLARGISRAREVAVRAALGASRSRLVRQMLAESLVLALAGAGAGLLVAHWGLRVLRAAFAIGPALDGAVVDARVLAFGVAASVLATLCFGLLPALQSARPEVTLALRDGVRTTGGVRTRRLRAALVSAEVAMAVLFLVVSLLFMRTLTALQRIEPGFDTANLLTLRVALPEVRYGSDESVTAFFERAVERASSMQGVLSAGAGLRVPAAGSRWNPNRSITIEGRPAVEGETLFAADLTVTPAYLETLRIPLRAGRALRAGDAAGAPLAVVVSEMMVRRYFGGDMTRALGARIRLGDEPAPDAWRTVVGVTGDVRNDDIDAPPLPMVYVPLAQRPSPEMTIVMRTAGDPLAHVAAARAAVAAVDPDQPVYEIRSMAQILEEDLRQSVVLIGIIGVFAAVALVLAALGIYGVVAHAVAQRTHEIGVRMALGAALGDVVRLVARQGLTPVAIGLACGVGAGMGVSQLMTSVLYGVTPTDPITYGAAACILAIVAMAACIVPARRAARIDPLLAIRSE